MRPLIETSLALLLAVSLRPATPEAAEAVPQRLISLSPNVTEILDGIGASGRLVAVSAHCEYPPSVASLPRVGGWMDTHLEKVVALRPDLVLMTGAGAQAPLVESKLHALGLKTVAVPSQSLGDVFAAIEIIGTAVGAEDEARRLLSAMRAELELIRARTRGLRPPRVLVVVDRLPGTLRNLYVATGESYLVELVRIAGGEPLTPEARHNYMRLGVEALVALDPEVVLDLVQALVEPAVLTSGGLAEDPLAVWDTLPITAARTNRVYWISDRRLVHPSQMAVLATRAIAERLHAEAFAE